MYILIDISCQSASDSEGTYAVHMSGVSKWIVATNEVNNIFLVSNTYKRLVLLSISFLISVDEDPSPESWIRLSPSLASHSDAFGLWIWPFRRTWMLTCCLDYNFSCISFKWVSLMMRLIMTLAFYSMFMLGSSPNQLASSMELSPAK